MTHLSERLMVKFEKRSAYYDGNPRFTDIKHMSFNEFVSRCKFKVKNPPIN